LAEAEADRESARQVIDDYDHPIQRRFHRAELDHAEASLRRAENNIRECRAQVADIDETMPKLRHSIARAGETLTERPALERERHAITRRLDRDLSIRGAGLAADPPDYLVENLGPRPDRSGAVELWDEAAARIDQHRTAFGLSDDYPLLGRPSMVWHVDAFATSQRAASSACDRLDRTLGRVPEIEPRGLELEIGF